MKQGQSALTTDKERRIGAALSIGMQIASVERLRNRGFKFFHFDANAGSGINNAALGKPVPGSPIVFWNVAKERLTGLAPRPWFCDNDEAAIRNLNDLLTRTHPDAVADTIIEESDNELGLRSFAQFIRQSREKAKFAVGSIIIDPNGYYYRKANGEGAPTNALPEFCSEFPRVDVILNMNMRFYRMAVAQREKNGYNYPGLMSPSEVLKSLRKSHWLVCKAGLGQSRFLLAVGRNTPTSDHKSMGFYDLQSEKGQEIVQDLSEDGPPPHPTLFG